MTKDLPSGLARLTFTACMALAWCGVERVPRAAAAAATEAHRAASPAEMADSLHKLATVCAAVDRDIPRDTFDPAAVVRSVGKDRGVLFAWTRDHIAYIPYRGALRGPIGVLMDRSGNSLDRALLLARLLQIAGEHVRLAQGQLEEKRAESLLHDTWEAPAAKPAEPPNAQPLDDATAARLATAYGVDPAEIRRGAERRQLSIQATEEELVGTTTEQSAALVDLIGPARPPADAARTEQLAAVADHWWVQVADAAGWSDLDPATRDAKPGARLTELAGTIDLPDNGQLPADPMLPRQEVEFRVRIERSGGGRAPTSEVVLKHTIRPAETPGVPVSFRVTPTDWPSDLDLTTGDAGAKLKAALLAQQHWVPSLQIDQETVIQSGFDTHGVTDPKPKLDPLAKAGGSAGGAAQSAADLLGGAPPAAPTTELTGAWLDLEIRMPGRPPRVITRDLFDALGPGARADANKSPRFDDALRLRRAVGLYRQVNVLAVGFVPSEAWVEHQAIANLLANEPVLEKALRESDRRPTRDALKSLAGIKRLPAAILSLAAGRRAPGGAGDAIAVDRPNLFGLSEGFALSPAGDLVARAGIDIIANETSIRPNDPAFARDAFKARLTQGVLETALERVAIGRPTGGVNPTSLYAASAGQNVKWVKIASADDPQLAKTNLSPDTRARIKADLASGYAVVAPSGPITLNGQPREGWWRIDPRNGSCVGMGADGTGPEMAEYALVLGSVLLESYMAYRCIKGGGYALACVVCGAAAVIGDILSMGFGMEIGGAAAVSGSEFGFARACEAAIAEE